MAQKRRVGFVAGVAIVIGLQQLKGLLGISHFTNKTDIISVVEAIWRSVHPHWSPLNFILGCSFLSFILITRYVVFWLEYYSLGPKCVRDLKPERQ